MARKKIEAPEVPVEDGQWKSRIVGTGWEDPKQLLANPLNWRTHPREQQQAIEGSLSSVGWVQFAMVNSRTGYLVDGHARVKQALDQGQRVPVVYVDLSPSEERLVLATLDPIGAMAGKDQEILNHDRPTVSDLHPTTKPVDLIVRHLKNSSRVGQIVLDGFGGSGSTLIAAEKIGRYARLIEKDPAYVDVIVRRWMDWTGKEAFLITDDPSEPLTFQQVADERGVKMANVA